MNKTTFLDVIQTADFLKRNDDYIILSHASPDGDTLGCAYALCEALQQMGKLAKVLCGDVISPRFEFLKEGIIVQEFEEKTVIAVDTADVKLFGTLEETYGNKVDLCIDHHVSNREYAKYTLLDSHAAAAGEIIYNLISKLGVLITKTMATAMYTAITTDTGCFKYASVTSDTHRITSALLVYDVDHAYINYLFFDLKNKNRLKLEQQALSSVELYHNDTVALIPLTKEMLEGQDNEDVGAIASLPRQIEGVRIGITLKWKEDGVWKASMRSVPGVDVSKLCERLGGGGHQNAAGCTVYGTLEEAKKQVLEVVSL